MQLNLENDAQIGYIFILYPPNLKKKHYTILLKLLTVPKIIKVLHGSESLDIPYIFNQLLVKKSYINKFCKNFYDTKIICDYVNLLNNYQPKKSCSIYDFLLHNNIITKNQINKLDKIEENMGPIYLIHINIQELAPKQSFETNSSLDEFKDCSKQELNNNLLQYALYDVLYLPQLIFKYIDNIWCNLISELLSLINQYKKHIDDTFNQLTLIINKLNNTFIYSNMHKYNLNIIWDIYFLAITDNDNIIILKDINYFKNCIKLLTKFVVYANLNSKFDIYENKYIKLKKQDFTYYFNWLKSYPNLYNLFYDYYKLISLDFDNWII